MPTACLFMGLATALGASAARAADTDETCQKVKEVLAEFNQPQPSTEPRLMPISPLLHGSALKEAQRAQLKRRLEQIEGNVVLLGSDQTLTLDYRPGRVTVRFADDGARALCEGDITVQPAQ